MSMILTTRPSYPLKCQTNVRLALLHKIGMSSEKKTKTYPTVKAVPKSNRKNSRIEAK